MMRRCTRFHIDGFDATILGAVLRSWPPECHATYTDASTVARKFHFIASREHARTLRRR